MKLSPFNFPKNLPHFETLTESRFKSRVEILDCKKLHVAYVDVNVHDDPLQVYAQQVNRPYSTLKKIGYHVKGWE